MNFDKFNCITRPNWASFGTFTTNSIFGDCLNKVSNAHAQRVNLKLCPLEGWSYFAHNIDNLRSNNNLNLAHLIVFLARRVATH